MGRVTTYWTDKLGRRTQRILPKDASEAVALSETLQYDVWGTLIKPGDLTDARRKGGTAPEQLYRRIHGGIGPSNMPAAIALSESQTWDVVHFLQALPYPDRLPEEVRGSVCRGTSSIRQEMPSSS